MSHNKIKLNIVPTVNEIDAVDQSWSLVDVGTKCVPHGWSDVFEDSTDEFRSIENIIINKRGPVYYPLKKNLFLAFHKTPLTKVRVVIIGQDPYPQTCTIDGQSVPRAQGLSFSVHMKDPEIPSSLQNIYKELTNTIPGFTNPGHGDLSEWANQGVLLLNTCLTIVPGEPKSHGKIWMGFIQRVLKAISIVNPNCIFMLWGNDAKELQPLIGEKSFILTAGHPSGLSASRKVGGFFGCNHFNLANQALTKSGQLGINWVLKSKIQIELSKPIIPDTIIKNVDLPIMLCNQPIIPNIPKISYTLDLFNRPQIPDLGTSVNIKVEKNTNNMMSQIISIKNFDNT